MLSLLGGAEEDASEGGASSNRSPGTKRKGGDKSRICGHDKDLGGWHGREAQQIPDLPRRRWEWLFRGNVLVSVGRV